MMSLADNNIDTRDEVAADFRRHSIMSNIFDKSRALRGGKYLLLTENAPEHVFPSGELTSEALELPSGRMVYAVTRTGIPRQRLTSHILHSACEKYSTSLELKATFLK